MYVYSLKLRHGHGDSLRVTVADADVDLLDTGFFGSGSSGTVELESS